jgi:predicted acyltransferase
MSDVPVPPSPARRIESLDQFRGYTVVGMILVNFIGGFAVVHPIFKHHRTYCSYADTIMPQFFFAVGYALRLSMLRRIDRDGASQAFRQCWSRIVGLVLLGFVMYHLDGNYKKWSDLQELGLSGFFKTAFRRELFQTLVSIGLATMWVLPVIGRSWRSLAGWLLFSAFLHVGLSKLWYFDWLMKNGVIDGGPFGFISWSIPVLLGALAYNAMATKRKCMSLWLMLLACVVMVIGYGLTCLDGVPDALPFVPPTAEVTLWTMSQKSGSVSYQTFGAGFSLAVFVAFVWISDVGGLNLAVFRTFGRNALAAYVLHSMVGGAVRPFLPNDVPLWYLGLGFSIYFGINYLFVRYLEKNQLFLKL